VLAEPFDVVADSVPSEESIDLVCKHAKGLKQYIHCSSTGGYAPLERIPGDESMPYGSYFGAGWVAKAIVDAKVMDLYAQGKLPATVIRPSYITGPGMVPIDNLGGRRQDFIPDILNETPLDLPNDGLALLHPVHVQDVAEPFILAAERPDTSIGEIYNVCLDKAVTLTRYLEVTAEALDRKVTIQYVPLEAMLAKYDGVADETGMRFLAAHMCFDIRKAREQLDYTPRCTVEEAIAENARWTAQLLQA
jgi:nucleoside-diphosphate-sugar epimerase